MILRALLAGPLCAEELSRLCGMDHERLYRRLVHLEALGLVAVQVRHAHRKVVCLWRLEA